MKRATTSGGWGPSNASHKAPKYSHTPSSSSSSSASFQPTYTSKSKEAIKELNKPQVLQDGLVYLPNTIDIETQVF